MAKRTQSAARQTGETSHGGIGLSGADGPAPRVAPETVNSLAASGYSEAEIFELVVAKRTLARRQAKREPLTVEESDKALRLARIADLANRVFGDEAKAHRWLRKPKRDLKGQTPLAFLASETGARTIEQMLHRIDHGIFG